MKDEMTRLTRPSPSLVPLRAARAAPPVDESGLWRPAFPPPPSSAAALFTPKGMQVLHLLARAYTNKETAISLEVSDQTVKGHPKQVFAKLEVGSRKQAVNRAQSLGVVAFDA